MSLIESGEGGKRKSRTKPTLVKVGNRWVISSGQFNLPLVADYVVPRSLPGPAQIHKGWMSVGEIAALKGGGASLTAKKQARRMMSRLAAFLLDEHSRVLIYEYDGRRIARVKVYDPSSSSEDEKKEAKEKVGQMFARSDLTAERAEKANSLINSELPEREVVEGSK